MQLDRRRIYDVQPAAMQSDVGTDLPCQQGMLFGGIIADQQNGRRVLYVAHGRRCVRFSCKRRGKGREVGGAVVIDVVGAQHQPRKLLQQVVLFVAGAVRTDDADRSRTSIGEGLLEFRGDEFERLLPGRRSELTLALDERLPNAVLMMGKVEGVTALDAQEVAVYAALVA